MNPAVVYHPGETLAEELEARKMSQAELARRMGRPKQTISAICRGKKHISAETALQLEKALGTPAHVWTRMTADYKLWTARKQLE